jgi:hypothetical protein
MREPIRRPAIVAFVRASVSLVATAALVLTANRPMAAPVRSAGPVPTRPAVAPLGIYRYSLNARLHWLFVSHTRRDVGSARVVRMLSPDDARDYELLIGSDPERTPMRINRWGYIAETVRRDSSRIVGVMTESDEDSAEAAKTSLERKGKYPFKAIRATVLNREATADVLRIAFADNFTLRDVETVLARLPEGGRPKPPIRLPEGASPGFLSALDDLVHTSVSAWNTAGRLVEGDGRTFVWDRGLYELKLQRSRAARAVTIGGRTYRDCIEGKFEIRNGATGDRTKFEMTYGTRDGIAEVPVRALYGPRWWFEVELVLAGS